MEKTTNEMRTANEMEKVRKRNRELFIANAELTRKVDELNAENESLKQTVIDLEFPDEYPVFDEVDLLEMELESATDEIERLKKKVENLDQYIGLLEYSYKQKDDDIRKLRAQYNDMHTENLEKIESLEETLSVQKGIVHVQDDCIDNMMDILKAVEAICDKWERASKMMIKNDHHAIAGVALQKMAADIRAAL